MNKKKVAIVVPFYKPRLTAYETIALRQCKHVLKDYLFIAVKPKKLDLPVEARDDIFHKVIEFDDQYFSGIAGYNRLMLTAGFYDAFNNFEYILIYQLDAFVFRDELSYWCDQGFDYIGAPWMRKKTHDNIFKSVFLFIQQKVSTRFDLKKKGVPNKYQFEGRVGNGGLSLRKVKTLKKLATVLQPKIEEYLKHQSHQYNEDAFWSIEVNRKKKLISIPSWQTGLKFAFENDPENCLKYNNHQLPFGCHAWDKNLPFWRPIFEKLGIEI